MQNAISNVETIETLNGTLNDLSYENPTASHMFGR
jgi:hypothetical protein